MTRSETRYSNVGTEAPAEIGELLIDWMNTSAPYYFEHIFEGHEGEWEDHPQYWDVLITLLSRG